MEKYKTLIETASSRIISELAEILEINNILPIIYSQSDPLRTRPELQKMLVLESQFQRAISLIPANLFNNKNVSNQY